jgi:hypothetical protein
MYYFCQTTVSIVGPLKKIITQACRIPAMDFGCRYSDLGQGFMISGSNVPSSDQWIRSSLFELMVEICFAIWALEFFKLQTLFAPIKSSRVKDLMMHGLQNRTVKILFRTSATFIWCYTLHNFGLLKAREPLI